MKKYYIAKYPQDKETGKRPFIKDQSTLELCNSDFFKATTSNIEVVFEG